MALPLLSLLLLFSLLTPRTANPTPTPSSSSPPLTATTNAIKSETKKKNVSFDFQALSLRNLTLLGAAFLRDGSVFLSPDSAVPCSSPSSFLYSLPVPFLYAFNSSKISSVSFSTRFTFSASNPSANSSSSSSGAGLAFFLSPVPSPLGLPGPFLGLFNSSVWSNSSMNLDSSTILGSSPGLNNPTIFAVEFDTRLDKEFSDPSDNHVGLDVNGPQSIATAELTPYGIELKSGNSITAWIDFYGDDQTIEVALGYASLKPEKPVLSSRLDLAQYLDEEMYVGFAASTQGSTEGHTIESWSFKTFGFPDDDISSSSVFHNVSGSSWSTMPVRPAFIPGKSSRRKLGVALSIFLPAALLITFVLLSWVVINRSLVIGTGNVFLKPEVLRGARRGPRQFRYRELFLATKGFHASRIVGTGAFGTVYRAIYPWSGTVYAVKRSKRDNQSKNEFIAELSIIASLRHKNLVQLQGWCTEKGELLLVYEFMPNGSLDNALYERSSKSGFSPVLNWAQRRNVAIGIAAVLAYLHQECERQVIHRDVKASNIMLDANFNPRLGDFGLAKLMDHNKSPVSTLTAGTMGYLAPEYLQYGKATEKSDVYSYGVVILEVCCGRRPIDIEDREDHNFINLVDWVWSLYSEDRLIEVADKSLDGEFEEEEMLRMLLLGLSCANPNCRERPTMRRVLQILNSEAELVSLPRSKPNPRFSCSTAWSLEKIVSDCEEGDLSSQLHEVRTD